LIPEGLEVTTIRGAEGWLLPRERQVIEYLSMATSRKSSESVRAWRAQTRRGLDAAAARPNTSCGTLTTRSYFDDVDHLARLELPFMAQLAARSGQASALVARSCHTSRLPELRRRAAAHEGAVRARATRFDVVEVSYRV